MKKYIITNCPAIHKNINVCVDDKYSNLCQDITDCLLKRIANKCGYASPDGGFNDSEAQDLANSIIDLLDIEEYE